MDIIHTAVQSFGVGKIFLRVYSHQGSSDSSLALVRTKGKKLYIVAIFEPFWFLFAPHCLLWSEPAETNQNAVT